MLHMTVKYRLYVLKKPRRQHMKNKTITMINNLLIKKLNEYQI